MSYRAQVVREGRETRKGKSGNKGESINPFFFRSFRVLCGLRGQLPRNPGAAA